MTADGSSVGYDRPRFSGLWICIPIEVLLNGNRCTHRECTVYAVVPPLVIGVAVMCIHHRAAAGKWLFVSRMLRVRDGRTAGKEKQEESGAAHGFLFRCPLSFESTSFAGKVVSPAAGKLKRKRQKSSSRVREDIEVLNWMLLGSGHCGAATPMR
jgi:hypothetical protein